MAYYPEMDGLNGIYKCYNRTVYSDIHVVFAG